jgi:hypothetical protein
MRAVAVLTLAVLAAPALSKDRPPQGIAFAPAGQGTWLCRHEDPREAMACAHELCLEQAPGHPCSASAWCLPARWSGVMVAQIADAQAMRALCGAPSEDALKAALTALCAGEDGATRCDLVNVIDPEGSEHAIEGVSFPGPAAEPPETAIEAPEQP